MKKRSDRTVLIVIGTLALAVASTALAASDSRSVNQLGQKIKEKARTRQEEGTVNLKEVVTTKKLPKNRSLDVLLNYRENDGRCLFQCDDMEFMTKWSYWYLDEERIRVSLESENDSEYIGYRKGYGDLPDDPRCFEQLLDFSGRSHSVAEGETIVFLNKDNCFLAVKVLKISIGRNGSRPFLMFQCRVYGARTRGDAESCGRKDMGEGFGSTGKPAADVYAEARAKIDALTKQIRQREGEVLKLRKENPACLLGELTRSIINLDKKYATTEQKRYYYNQVTYVRPHFYCTRCKEEHDDKCSTSAKQSWNRWRDHYDKISDTAVYNEKIDALMSEIEDFQGQLVEVKKEKDEAAAAMQKERGQRKRGAK